MKKYFTCSILFLVYCSVFSQISIDVSDIADAGESFIVSTANPVGEYDLETTGEGAVWDFSDLVSVTKDTIDWVEASDTDPAYFLLWFSSDVAENFLNGFSTDSFSLEDVYNFYSRSSSRLEQTGIAGTLSGIPVPAGFSEPDVVYDFPLEYETEFSSEAEFTFDVIFASFSETRERSSVVDGWGTITTPLGTYDVLRLESTIFTTDILEYDGTEIPFTYTNHEYKWLAKEMGVPVLQINTSDIGGFEAITTVTYQDTAVITGTTAPYYSEESVSVFPNPVTEVLHISVSAPSASEYYFQITDAAGNQKYLSEKTQQREGSFMLSKNICDENFSAGIYVLKVFADDTLVAVKKLIILPQKK